MTESPYYYSNDKDRPFDPPDFSIDPIQEMKFFEEVIWVIKELYETTSLDEMIRAHKAKEGDDGDSVLASFIILKDNASDIQKILRDRIEQINKETREIYERED